MSGAYYLVGDVREVLARLADIGVFVDLVVCSPPFLAQRSYLPSDDPNKAREIGLEATPGDYVDALLDVTESCDRVLAPHGSLCVELGDTYAGSGGAGGDYASGGLRAGQPVFAGSGTRCRADGNDKVYRGGQRLPDCTGPSWPADKSLSLVPEAYRLALAYGTNLHTGRITPRWRVRNVVSWVRPNPPVGRDGDKFRPATSDLVIACSTDEAGRRRYWDGDAVRVPSDYDRPNLAGQGSRAGDAPPGQRPNRSDHTVNRSGAPLLDWWKITAAGYQGAHYATFPSALVEPLVKAMCPPRVCRVCGEASRRICGDPTYERTDTRHVPARLTMRDGERPADGVRQFRRPDGANTSIVRHSETIGWSDCGHNRWRPGIVLDPFAGTGTTLAVATGLGRIGIGIDLDDRNVALARERVGPLLFQEATVDELAGIRHEPRRRPQTVEEDLA